MDYDEYEYEETTAVGGCEYANLCDGTNATCPRGCATTCKWCKE